MKKSILCLMIMTVAALALLVPDADAYDRYKDAFGTPGSNCSACHGDFTSGESMKSPAPVFPSNNKHTMHRSTMGSDCDLCHTNGDGRIPWTGLSNGTANNPGLGCTGCHEGVGLRAHHAWAGVTFCAACHPGDPTPDPEDFIPVYYGTVDTLADDPCNPVAAENVNENWTIGDFLGLDNDGDGLYDTADPDCDCFPTGTPETECNGIDDDCDGAIDEDYEPTPTFCGVGVCANTGLLECQDGQLSDTCVELPQDEATDVTCDGRDGDCDGSIDEDYIVTATTCGVGECSATGALECQGGAEVDTCMPETPAADDATCDGLDNDCDGSTDEDFTSTPTTCGVGECSATGATTCVGGVEGDTCTPGTPAADDATCDGLDNDCDGSTDEDYLVTATTCGVGECSATGALECQGGAEVDTCTPGTPAAEVCDNLDNDCDGTTDEGGVCEPGAIDLDIAAFQVSKRVSTDGKNPKAITIKLTVKNNGEINNAMRQATVIGVQNGTEVYNETIMVSDAVGDGRSKFQFPSFTPAEAGIINWTVEIFDDDPDVDFAAKKTQVK
jgi:hypothetical protein